MVIAGVTCYPNRWPKPDTRLALEWTKTDPIRYRATTRPPSNDQYFSDIEIWDTEAVINSLFTALKDPLNLGAITVNLGSGDERYIFGADTLCTSVTVVTYGLPKEAGSFKMFSLSLRLKALNPTFSGTAQWPALFYAQPAWVAGSTFELSKLSSFNNSMTYQNKKAEEGIFECTFLTFTQGIREARRKIAAVRGAQTTFPDVGINNPFGTTLPGFDASYVRIVDWKDLGRQDYLMWGLWLKLAYDGPTA